MELFHWITDLLMPSRCLGCQDLTTMLCDQCADKIARPPWKPESAYWAATAMTDPLARLVIWHFKYRNCRSLAGPLATLMARRWIRSGDREWFSGNPLLVPVPLHPKRLAERGYNQAELLARELARIAALEVSANALVRVRHTASQVETASRDERQENMRDAFTCAKPELVAGRDIVLIDDVSTTGATLDACTGALHLARASTITALVLARG